MESKMTIGMLFAYAAYKEQLISKVGSLIDAYFGYRTLAVHAERVADIVHTHPERAGAINTGDPSPAPNEAPMVVVDSLSFRYSASDPFVFENLTMQIDPGEYVVLVGPSGCGKTTFLKILLGLLEPTAGKVTFQYANGRALAIAGTNIRVAAVMQDDSLFAGSIAQNISLFDQQEDLQWVSECARMAAVDGEIEQLPMAYHTPLGDCGVGLSGGQKQRILLARALYQRPDLIVLDEATSHLDSKNEALINDTLKRLGVTRIGVAHRRETIGYADRVIRFPLGI
jgi:ATP-binding cassette subfamily B protein RaxB